MKTFPAWYTAHLALNPRDWTLAHALKLTREDGDIFGFTSHDIDDTVAGVPYLAFPGLVPSSIVTSAGLAVGTLELKALHDGSIFTLSNIKGGIWKNAAFTIFRYNYASLADGIGETLLVGTVGELELKQGELVIELRDLRQYLQQAVGSPSQKNCRYRLGDAKCGVVLVGSPSTGFTSGGALTGVGDNQTFQDTARYEAADFYGQGHITMTSGANTGIMRQVKTYAADGTFTIWQSFPNTVTVGDTYTAVAGCRLRFAEDCIAKYNNAINFGGEPHRPLIDALTEDVRVDV